MKLQRFPAHARSGVRRRVVAVPAACAAVLAAYVVTGTSVGDTVAHLPFSEQVTQVTATYLPQGWGFFTKPAGSEMLVPYAITDSGLVPKVVGVNAEPRFMFGFNRTSRVQAPEITLLLQGRDESKWHKCEGNTQAECLADDDLTADPVVNQFESPTVCGPTAIFAEQVTPFEWRNQEKRLRIPTQVTLLDVQCEGADA